MELIKVTGQSGYEIETVVTNPGLKSVDDATTLTTNAPINILPVDTNYSYECWLRFKVDVAPSNLIDNFKIWGDGLTIATGVLLSVNSSAVSTYVTPVDIQSAVGTRIDFINAIVGAEILLAGELVNVGDETDFLVVQEEVSPSAGAGDVSMVINYSYDES